MSDDCPKLRQLEALPFAEEGQPRIILRDPTQLGRSVLAVSPEIYRVLTLFDGRNSLLDIQAELTRRSGQIVFREDLENLLQQLDAAYFLENENFRRHRTRLMDDFRSQETRAAFHSGVSYPAERADLIETLNSFYRDDEGAGLPGAQRPAPVRAIVAPHIDLRLGGPVYTHAYRLLAESPVPDLFVVLGTGHMGLPSLFSISRKHFQTPLGTAQTDRDFLRVLREIFREPLFEEDLSHRNEHTIEFQVLFLQHLFRNQDLKILPVLCSFSYLDLDPAETQRRSLFNRFIKAVRLAEKRTGKRVCLVASVDLAHIGPRYGDSFRPDDGLIARTARLDHQMLERVTSGDPEGFFGFVAEEQDRRRICGFSPLYTLLTLLEGQRGELLRHSYARMDPMGSFVTYASLVF